ncbi:hypothetical protein ACLB2K_004739 [Fragaria x ananassa]
MSVRITTFNSNPELGCVAYNMPPRSFRSDEGRGKVKRAKVAPQKVLESAAREIVSNSQYEVPQSKCCLESTTSSLLSNLGSRESSIVVDEYGTNRGQVRKDSISHIVVTPFGCLPLVSPAPSNILSPLEQGEILVAVPLRNDVRSKVVAEEKKKKGKKHVMRK